MVKMKDWDANQTYIIVIKSSRSNIESVHPPTHPPTHTHTHTHNPTHIHNTQIQKLLCLINNLKQLLNADLALRTTCECELSLAPVLCYSNNQSRNMIPDTQVKFHYSALYQGYHTTLLLVPGSKSDFLAKGNIITDPVNCWYHTTDFFTILLEQ